MGEVCCESIKCFERKPIWKHTYVHMKSMRTFSVRHLLVLTALCLAAYPAVGADCYLGRLSPVVLLHFDQKPSARVELPKDAVLKRAPSFSDTQAVLVDGPRPWTGSGWDFSVCKGPYLLAVNEAMSRVGDIEATDGMSVAFWCRGTYSGRISRIMTGPFEIGSQRGGQGLWGGSTDYQTAQMDRRCNAWDGKWHHVAVTVDFRAKRSNVRIYLDGEVAGVRNAVYTKSLASGSGRTWSIGARNANDVGFDYGALADIAVFDRVLSDPEIRYIVAGPVYAGQDQEVVLPNAVRLRGFAPVEKSSTWSQVHGPAIATVVSPGRPSTEVRFPMPGQYRFTLTSAGMSSSVQVKVIANQPPKVTAGDGIVLSSGVRRVRLKGTVSDPSIAADKRLRSRWIAASVPNGGRVTFKDREAAETDVTFEGKGLFTLRLTATDGELEAASDVSVLVDVSRTVSYLRLLNPLFLLGCERPAARTFDAQADDTGRTGYLLRFPEHGLPRLIEGARPFTGYAWDMTGSDCDIRVINGDQLRHLYEQELAGRSISCWIRGDDSPPGFISDFLGMIRIHKSYGLTVDMNGLESMNARIGAEVLDGKWHHIAIVVATQNGEVTRTIYLDAREVARVAEPIPTSWWTLGSPEIRHPKHIGSRGRSGTDSFNGEPR